MEKAVELAGQFAAHAIWCVSDGGPLTPMLAMEMPGGQIKMQRQVAERLEDAAHHVQEALERNGEGAVRAASLVDGYMTLDDGKTDAILIDIRVYGVGARSLSMAVPYRNADHPNGFAVHRPKFLVDLEGQEHQLFGEAFFRGVDSHEEGAKVWNDHIDQSR